MAELFWLSDKQWAAIEPHLPDLGGKPRVDDRRVISGILHRFREGLRRRANPEAYGPRTTLFNRFNRWSKKGIWQALLAALAAVEELPERRWWTAQSCARIAQRRAQKRAAESETHGNSPPRACARARLQEPTASWWVWWVWCLWFWPLL